jgi:predicted enzyme related to lactoylglutathione lyase
MGREQPPATTDATGGKRMDFNSVLIGSEDPKRLTEYYSKLFGEPAFDTDGYTGWQLGTGWITVGPHSDVSGKNPQPGRMLLNIESSDVKGEFDKMKAAGATVVQEPYQMGDDPGWIATLSDPDDNYFQLMSPMSA